MIGLPVIPVYKQQRSRLCFRPAILGDGKLRLVPVVWWRRSVAGSLQEYDLQEFDGKRCFIWSRDE